MTSLTAILQLVWCWSDDVLNLGSYTVLFFVLFFTFPYTCLVFLPHPFLPQGFDPPHQSDTRTVYVANRFPQNGHYIPQRFADNRIISSKVCYNYDLKICVKSARGKKKTLLIWTLTFCSHSNYGYRKIVIQRNSKLSLVSDTSVDQC